MYFVILKKNIKFKFNIFNLIFYNLNKVINKLDIYLRTFILNLLYPGLFNNYDFKILFNL